MPTHRWQGKGRGTARNVRVTLSARNTANGQVAEFQLLWLLPPNPLVLTFEPGDKFPVHFLTVDLEGHEIMIPTTPLGEVGKWSGTLLPPGTYELSIKPTGGKWINLAEYDLPNEVLDAAQETQTARHARESRGYVVYFEKGSEGQGTSINWQGQMDEERLRRLAQQYNSLNPTFLVNGTTWTPPPPSIKA